VVQRIIDNRRKYEARTANRGAKDLKYLENKTYIEEGGNRSDTPITSTTPVTTTASTTGTSATTAKTTANGTVPSTVTSAH
jgi:hypothetical protein